MNPELLKILYGGGIPGLISNAFSGGQQQQQRPAGNLRYLIDDSYTPQTLEELNNKNGLQGIGPFSQSYFDQVYNPPQMYDDWMLNPRLSQEVGMQINDAWRNQPWDAKGILNRGLSIPASLAALPGILTGLY